MKRLFTSLAIIAVIALLAGCNSRTIRIAYQAVQDQVYTDLGPDADLPCCAEDYYTPEISSSPDIHYFWIPMTYHETDFIIHASYVDLPGSPPSANVWYTDSQGNEIDIP